MKYFLISLSAICLLFFKENHAAEKQIKVLDNESISCCESMPDRFSSTKPKEYNGMIWIPGGTFIMGGEVADFMKEWPHIARPREDERPSHRVKLSDFWISETPVTNREFKLFVDATGYLTTAERAPTLEEILPLLPPGAPPPSEEVLVAASLVFKAPSSAIPLNNALAWWEWRPNANWKRPEGLGSSIKNRMDHPVVHVSYFDALAYAEWKGMSLPTEAQWEYAARGGKEQMAFIWGNEKLSEEDSKINTWQGSFPHKNTNADGYYGSSPVKYYEPNSYGIYDMSGNVWEWVSDWYHVNTYENRSKQKEISLDPKGPIRIMTLKNPIFLKGLLEVVLFYVMTLIAQATGLCKNEK